MDLQKGGPTVKITRREDLDVRDFKREDPNG